MVGVSNGKEIDSVITIADENRHNRLRRSVANAFAAVTTLDYEPHIDRTIEELLKSMDNQRTFDLSRKMAYFGLDASSGFAFNSPKGCLAADADIEGMIAITRERMRHWSRWGSLPGIERLLFRNPISMRTTHAPQSGIVTAARSRLAERKKTPQKDSETPDLLTRFLEALETNPDTLSEASVISLLMSMIAAGSDTSANALAAILFHLMKNPKALAKLQDEFEAADLSRPIPAYSQVSKLPYLHAVIREGMRLFPALTHPMERLVPAGGANVAGIFIPQGTSVGCLQLAMHLNKKVFGEDAKVFRPERWLEASAEQLRVMEMAHIGFGRGRRVCIGQHIAVMEMKKVIPAMLMNFEVSPVMLLCLKILLLTRYQMSLNDPTADLDADIDLAVACPKALFVNIEPKV
jgi:cytochrome P450